MTFYSKQVIYLTQVGWASQNVAKVLVPHNFVAVFGQVGLELLQTVAESGENGLDVAALLHGDDTEVVLLVDPDQEVLGLIVPDAAGVGPVTGHTGTGQKWRNWLVEKEVIVDELVLLSLGHGSEGIVFALELAVQLGKS